MDFVRFVFLTVHLSKKNRAKPIKKKAESDSESEEETPKQTKTKK